MQWKIQKGRGGKYLKSREKYQKQVGRHREKVMKSIKRKLGYTEKKLGDTEKKTGSTKKKMEVGVERVSNIQGRVQNVQKFQDRVGSVTRVTLRYRPTIVLCCINRTQNLNRKIHYPSIKLGHLAVLARSSYMQTKRVKFIKVQQRHATATVLVSTGYLCKYPFCLPIVVKKQRTHNKLLNNKIQRIIY